MIDTNDAQRLRTLLDRPELTRLVDALQRRLERGVTGDTLNLTNTTDIERQAIEQLMGRAPGRGRSLRIALPELEQVLRNAGVAPDLRTAIQRLRGPLRDLPAERSEQERRWRRVFTTFEHRDIAAHHRDWLSGLDASGLLKRLSQADPDTAARLLEGSLAVLDRLPADGLSSSRLAAEALGDAHGLDPGRPVATLARQALLRQIDGDWDSGAEADRELWASAGVLIGGAITSTVLVLNLPATDDSATSSMLKPLADSGEPAFLTLRQLVRDHPDWDCRDRPIHVCENPAVVAEAAAELGRRCRPLICTRGQPSAATGTLLHALSCCGARLLYHGDFDWPGIRIANRIIERHGALPWRFGTDDYRSAPPSGKPLSGSAVAACWDAELEVAMMTRGEVIEEELCIEKLLGDLGRS